MQNTYHKKTAHCISMVVRNMPELSNGEMEYWAHNPEKLKTALSVLKFEKEEKCPYKHLEILDCRHTPREGKILAGALAAKEIYYHGEGVLDLLLSENVEKALNDGSTSKNLYVLSGKDLGLTSKPSFSFDDVRGAFIKNELGFCSADCGALYAIQHMETGHEGDLESTLFFVSIPLFSEDHQPYIFRTFYVGGVPHLAGTRVIHDSQHFNADDRFVLMS